MFDYQQTSRGPDSDLDPNAAPTAPRWLRQLVGEDAFRKIIYANLSARPVTDDWVRASLPTKELRCLLLDETRISDSAAVVIGSCDNLEALSLDGTAIGDPTIDRLRRLSRLRYLSVDDTLVTDKCLDYLREMPALVELSVNGTAISESAVTQFGVVAPKVDVRR